MQGRCAHSCRRSAFRRSARPDPACIPFEHAAILDPAANAYRAVVQKGGLLPGEMIAVFGVGALGLFSIQIARIAGAAEIIAVGLEYGKSREEKGLRW